MKPAESATPVSRTRVRLWMEKRGRYRFVSHLGMVVGFRRALRRSGLPVCFSQGFHPLPRLSFGQALRLGFESLGEPVDMLIEGDCEAKDIKDRLNRELPEGLKIKKASVLAPDSRKCTTAFTRTIMAVSFITDRPCKFPAVSDRLLTYGAEVVEPPRRIDEQEKTVTGGSCVSVRYRARIALPVERSSKVADVVSELIGDNEIISLSAVRESFY